MSGREAETTISNLLQSARASERDHQQKVAYIFTAQSKSSGAAYPWQQNPHMLFFKYLGSAGRKEGAFYMRC